MSTYKDLVNTITPLLGKPFKLGGQNPQEGFDCLSFIRYVYERLGAEFPSNFQGKNWGNYWKGWEQRREDDLMESFLMSLGRPVEPTYRLPGDLIVVGGTDGTVFPSIILLNQNAVTIDRKMGVMVYPYKVLKMIKATRRIIEIK